MMKTVFAFVLLVSVAISAVAQDLTNKDLDNLVALSHLYSYNNMFSGEAVAKSADSLRTPALNHVIDALIATGKADTSLLGSKFITRPGNDELKLWYIIREIHYNRIDTTRKKQEPLQIARDILKKDIDERWLVDNYYHMPFSAGVALLFNTADLSNYNFNMDELGLKNDTEKAIFFMRMIDPMIRARFIVLMQMKKYDKMDDCIKRLPKFNNKPYYYFTNFSFADFDWPRFNKSESYKRTNLNEVVRIVMMQFTTEVLRENKKAAAEIYRNSVLNKSEYFEYTDIAGFLQKMYDKNHN